MASTPVETMQQFLKNSKGFEKVMDGIKLISAGKGNSVSELEISLEHTNIFGRLHGGFATTLIDVMSSYTLLTHERGYCAHVSVNLNIDFLKEAKLGDTILIDAKTLKIGKTLAFMEVEIKDKCSGALLVKGSHVKCLLSERYLT